MLTGHCNRCGKIWTLETRQGLCQWCGNLAVCQSSTAKPRQIKSSRKRNQRQDQSNGNGYDQLEGEWSDWLAVAIRYEHRVPSQDRYDIRHTIILELAKARKRDDKPIPQLRAYRIASLTVALYWREQLKTQVKVCLYDGLPKQRHCATCKQRSRSGSRGCPYQGLRPIQSLDTETEGERLKDTVADDNGIDVDAWLDAKTWLLGCPVRLVQIAYKKLEGIPLDTKDRKYLSRYRQQEQARLF